MSFSVLMSIAAGLAIGYFVYQFAAKKPQGATQESGEAEVKRLHKSVKEKKIAGVCGGIAEYLNTDPTIIRLAWAILALGWGTGVLAYILCAIILPEGE